MVKYCDKIVEIGIYGITFLIPLYFDIHLFSTFDLSKVGLMYLVSLIMLAAWLTKMALTGNFRSIVTPITIPILALWASFIISTIFSTNPMMSLFGAYKRYEGLLAFTCYILQFFFVVNFIDTREKFYRLLRAFLYAGLVSGVYGAIQYFGLDPIAWEGGDVRCRAASTLGNPIFFGGYTLMVFMIGLGMYLRVSSQSRTFRHREIFWVVLWTICVAIAGSSFLFLRASSPYITTLLVYTLLIGVSLVFFRIPKDFPGRVLIYGASAAFMYYGFTLAVTRGAYIGMFCGLLFFLILLGGKGIIESRKRLILLGLVIFALFFNFNVINQNTSVIKRFRSSISSIGVLIPSAEASPPLKGTLPSPQPEVLGNRVYIYRSTLKALWDNPRYLWLGAGPDTMGFYVFPIYAYKILPPEWRGRIVFHDKVHNNILDITLARGIIGLGIYAWLLSTFFLTGIKYLKRIERRERVILIGLMAAVIGFLGQGLVGLDATSLSSAFWLLLGTTMVSTRLLLPRPPKPVKSPISPSIKVWPICLLVILIVTLLSYFTIRAYIADGHYRKGLVYLANKDLDRAIARYEQAVRLNPYEVKYRDECIQLYIEKAQETSSPEWADKAIRASQNLLELFPDYSNTLFTLAKGYHLKGNTKKAMAIYRRTIELNPFFSEAYNNIGEIFVQEERFAEAFGAFREAYRVYAYYTTPLDNLNKLAQIYLSKGMSREADLIFKEIKRLNPDYRIRNK